MPVNTYKAQLNYYDHTYGWGNAGTCAQGNGTAYGAGSARTGVLYFPGLSALNGKIINSVKITTTNTASGVNASKTAHFYRSANQGGIKTSLGANHKTGSEIGTLKGNFHAYANASLTFTPAFFSPYIALGEDTYCIYSNAAADYLVWSGVTLTVDWSEPATQPVLDNTAVELGQPVTITTAAMNSAYRHTLRYAFGSASGTIAENVEGSASWTPPVSLAEQIPNAVSDAGTIFCDTYSGTDLLGTKSAAITFTVPEAVKPTAGTLSAEVTDDTSGTGLFVKGMGKAKLTLSGAAGVYGSTIKSYKITGGGWSSSESTLTTGMLAASSEITFTGTVMDSRGRTSDGVTCTISVIDYAKPGITSCLVYRCDENGKKKNAGTYVAVEPIIAYSGDVPGNTLTLTAAYRLASEEHYGASAVLTNNVQNIIGGDISAAKTYSVKITIADSYNSIELTVILSTKSVIMSFLKGVGMAIGKVAELSGWLDVAWNALFRKDVQINGNLQLGGTVTGGVYALGAKPVIPKNSDVRTYTTPGAYAVPDNSFAAEIDNLPEAAAGTLIVENITGAIEYDWSMGYLLQTYKTYTGNIYVRASGDAGASWTAWK